MFSEHPSDTARFPKEELKEEVEEEKDIHGLLYYLSINSKIT